MGVRRLFQNLDSSSLTLSIISVMYSSSSSFKNGFYSERTHMSLGCTGGGIPYVAAETSTIYDDDEPSPHYGISR
jgi:hypothetical protein